MKLERVKMAVRSKALSLSFWFMTPCGVSTGILSFGDGVVEGAMGGGCGIWDALVKLGFCCCCFFCWCVVVFFVVVFFLFLFFFLSPRVWGWESDSLLYLILIYIAHG